jgi:hypothetical protein
MRTVLLISLLFTTEFVFSQPSSVPEKIDFTKFTTPQRKAFYPFSKASHLKLVSFRQQENTDKRKAAIWGLPILNDTICFSRLDQVIELTPAQTDTLTDIIYNTCSRWTIIQTTTMGCYRPRNAILFFDSTGNAFAYIEICFECHGIKNSSREIVSSDNCDLMYHDLQSFFHKLGLKTDPAID